MSTTGNRSNPNQTRTSGHPDEQRKPDDRPTHGRTYQESRDHNKHNDPGQDSHKLQRHTPAEKKH